MAATEFDPNCYYYEYAIDTQSDRSSSSAPSLITSPMEGPSYGAFPLSTSYWETPCLAVEQKSPQEAAEALKMHKEMTRKAQNRSAQRAYRERQQTRLKEMQATIEDLRSDRENLRSQVKDLENDLNRVKMEATIQRIKSQRRNTIPINQPQRGPSLRSEDSVGWMLKHMYGLDEAEDDLFAVFEVKGKAS